MNTFSFFQFFPRFTWSLVGSLLAAISAPSDWIAWIKRAIPSWLANPAVVLLGFLAMGPAMAEVAYTSNPGPGTPVSGSTIWLKLNSAVPPTGQANFSVGKLSGNFTANGTLRVFVNNSYQTSVAYSAGAGTVNFGLAFGTNPGSYEIKAQRYDQTIPGGYDGNVVSGVVKITATTINTAPVVSSLGGSQGGAGQPLELGFTIQDDGLLGRVRVHYGATQFGTYVCYQDLDTSKGSKHISFSGGGQDQNGRTCASLIPTTGSATIWFKVEAIDAAGLTAAVQSSSAIYTAAVTNKPPVVGSIGLTQGNSDGSVAINFAVTDPEGQSVGADAYIFGANGVVAGFSAGSKKSSTGASGSARNIVWTAAESSAMGLEKNKTYSVAVDAFDNLGLQSTARTYSSNFVWAGVASPLPPKAPILTISPTGSVQANSRLTLGIASPQSGTTYKICVGTTPGRFEQGCAAFTPPMNITAGANWKYYLAAKAIASGLESSLSNEIYLSVQGETDPKLPVFTSGVDIQPATGGFSLRWNAATGNLVRYELYRSTASGALGAKIFEGQAVNFQDLNLATGTTYYYTAKACNATACVTGRQDFRQFNPELVSGICNADAAFDPDPIGYWSQLLAKNQWETAAIKAKDPRQRTPAEIIYYGALENGINPLTVMAFIQKESSLVARPFAPLDNPGYQTKLNNATGYRVFNGQSSSAGSPGFFAQVTGLSFQIRLWKLSNLGFRQGFDTYQTANAGNNEASHDQLAFDNFQAAYLEYESILISAGRIAARSSDYYSGYLGLTVKDIQTVLQKEAGRMSSTTLFCGGISTQTTTNTGSPEPVPVTADVLPSDGYDFPQGVSSCSATSPEGWHLSTNFLDRSYSLYGGNHPAEDWNFGSGNADVGLPVTALSNGRVEAVSSMAFGVANNGGAVLIKHIYNGQAYWTLYAHITTLVSPGDQVYRGQPIGLIASGPNHLHIEIRNTALSVNHWPSGQAAVDSYYENPTNCQSATGEAGGTKSAKAGFIPGHLPGKDDTTGMAAYRSAGIIAGLQGQNYVERRASFVAILLRALKKVDPSLAGRLNGASEWLQATNAHLIDGTRPDDPISKFEAATVISRTINMYGTFDLGSSSLFNDTVLPQNSSIANAVGVNFFLKTTGSFYPEGWMTRGEVIDGMRRLFSRFNLHPENL